MSNKKTTPFKVGVHLMTIEERTPFNDDCQKLGMHLMNNKESILKNKNLERNIKHALYEQ